MCEEKGVDNTDTYVMLWVPAGDWDSISITRDWDWGSAGSTNSTVLYTVYSIRVEY